ncbi:hypothetical protein [Rhizobium lusitanum]|uniref:PD-(D/E)XK nuclease superfamily protein n=1 Tax=Rhizobium lusitanum TaxID=293958 RepID=A0A1C3WXP5_9HYPH|nr:hypothetical protein [Rhizobium lusitanum]SCB44769.1 hypothetical protein GA0061101_11998 [Rhizobium lusitanum]
MDEAEVRSRFESALHSFMVGQIELLKFDVNERAVGAVFAHLYLRDVFPDHKVDAEYNRVGFDGDPKRLNLTDECRGPRRRVIPDIVVHRRGNNDNNLLVVEMKMQSNKQPRECDRVKLIAFREQLHYRFGVFVDFPAGPELRLGNVSVEWFC